MTQVLVILILVVFTSAVILALVKFGVLDLKEQQTEPILNADFIPITRSGDFSVTDFSFCDSVDESFNCQNPTENFFFGQEVHFWMLLKSTPVNGEIKITENYQILNPQGEVIFDVGDRDNYNLDLNSDNEQNIPLTDYFVVNEGLEPGEYTLKLLLENPLLDKKLNLIKKFNVEEFTESTLEGGLS